MSEKFITCLGCKISLNDYPPSSYQYLKRFPNLLSRQELCKELDKIWDQKLKNNNYKLSEKFFSDYYSHPVWCLNAIFSSIDKESFANRLNLINFLNKLPINSLADMGGGYGTLLKMIKKYNPDFKLILSEPYISESLESRLKAKGITIDKNIPENIDAYLFIDVLEHIKEPLKYLQEISFKANLESYFIFGNCFKPVIKCHLKSNLYLDKTFPIAASLMGFRKICKINGAEYIQLYKFINKRNINYKYIELITRVLSYFYMFIYSGYKILKYFRIF